MQPASMQSHLQAKQALVAERQALLQQQALVLQEHVRAGVALPQLSVRTHGTKLTAGSDTQAEQQRRQLLAQLVQEQGAAQAALESLKQGSSLAKARQVGQRVMQQQQQQLQTHAGRPETTIAAAARQSVLLPDAAAAASHMHAGAGAAAAGDTGSGSSSDQVVVVDSSSSSRIRSGHQAPAALQQQQQRAGQLPAQTGLSDSALCDSFQEQHHQQQWQQSEQARHPPPYSQQQQQQQQHYHQHNQQPATADLAALQQQMAALHHTLIAAQQQQPLSPTVSAAQHAAAAGYGCCSPVPHHLKSPQAAAAAAAAYPSVWGGPASPAAAGVCGGSMGAVGAFRPAHQQHPFYCGSSCGSPVPQQQPAAAAAALQDPSLAAAVAAHARDMTLLRMDVERTRGTAELQQARAELAALSSQQQQQRGAGSTEQQQYPSVHSRATADLQPAAAAGSSAPADTSALLQQQQQFYPQIVQQQQQQPGDGSAASAASDDDEGAEAGGWLADAAVSGPAAAGAGAEGAGRGSLVGSSRGGFDQEVLSLQPDGVLAAARGSGGEPDVLQVHVTAAGPFSKRGTYRVCAVLYNGFQPVVSSSGPSGSGSSSQVVSASTSRRAVSTQQQGSSVAAGPAGRRSTANDTSTAAGPDTSSSSSSSADPSLPSAAAAAVPAGIARFQESLAIKGVRLSASHHLVFELHCAKPAVAGLPSREMLVAWAATPLMQSGQVLPGLQSLPLLRLPIMLSCTTAASNNTTTSSSSAPGGQQQQEQQQQAAAVQRHWSYDGALLDFRLARFQGAPGDVEATLTASQLPPAGVAANSKNSSNSSNGCDSSSSGHEDLPGVPAEAWVRVSRGLLPSEPYTQGDGIVAVIDGARFLPASTTISRVVASVWSSSGTLLAGPFEGLAQPGSDARSPVYGCKLLLDAAQNGSSFDDPTATLLMQVHTIERSSRALRVVGFALLALFLDPRDAGQPLSRSIDDYVLNTGALQVPLHAGAPPTDCPLRMTSLDDVPRVPCASLLVRVMTPEVAKAQRRKPLPVYSDRVYDSVARAMPSALERRLFGRLLAARQQQGPWAVREAARLVAWYRRQPGGLSGRRTTTSGSSSASAAGSSRRSTRDPAPAAAKAAGDPGNAAASGGAGLFTRLLAGIAGGDGSSSSSAGQREGGVSAGLRLNTGDPTAAVAERQEDLQAAKAELLPPNDGDISDWMADTLAQAESAATAATTATAASLSFINFNLAVEYLPELGFSVAVDGAMRLGRPLPAACIISASPPGSMYQDHPLVDDVRLTLDYDLDAPLSAPRWLDGYQAFTGVPYHPGLVLLLDVRCLVPGSSTAAPAGWACLPVFEGAGRFVASGVYHLPLFQGIPSHQLLTELTEGGDPDAVMAAALASGSVRPSLDCSSVCVRLACGSRQGQLEAPAWSLPLTEHRLTRHTVSQLGAGFVAEMRKHVRTRTYAQAKPKALTDEQWVDQINDTLLRISGVDDSSSSSSMHQPGGGSGGRDDG